FTPFSPSDSSSCRSRSNRHWRRYLAFPPWSHLPPAQTNWRSQRLQPGLSRGAIARISKRHGQAELREESSGALRRPGVVGIEDHPSFGQLIEVSGAHNHACGGLKLDRSVEETVRKHLKSLGHLLLNRPLVGKLIDVEIRTMNDGNLEAKSGNE